MTYEPESRPRSVSFTVGIDTDGDGLWDAWENRVGLDPSDPGDATSDSDGDGLLAWQEQAAGSHPGRLDTDDDGYSDAVEVAGGSDPADPESVSQMLHGAFGEPVPTVGQTVTSDVGGIPVPLLAAAGAVAVVLIGAGGWFLWRRRADGKP